MPEERRVGGSTSTRRLRDYKARQRELTDAFNLPEDLRVWVTLRMDTDEDTDDHISIGGSAGHTNTTMDFPLPAGLKRELKSFLADHRGDMEHQLKLDLATNLLASMSGAFSDSPEDAA